MKFLKSLASSHTAEHRQVQRAKIILLAGEGFPNAEIFAKSLFIATQFPPLLKKHFSADLQYALNDSERSGKPNLITDEEKVFITNIAVKSQRTGPGGRTVDFSPSQRLYT